MPTIPVQTRLAPPPAPGPSASFSAAVAAASSAAPSSPIHPDASPSAPSAALDLHIDSLVLHGFSGVDGRRAGAAFEKELSRLLSDSGSPLSGYASGSSALADSSAAGDTTPLSVEFVPGRPDLTGRRAARALHARLRA